MITARVAQSLVPLLLALSSLACGGPGRPAARITARAVAPAEPALVLDARSPTGEGGTEHSLDALTISLPGVRPIELRYNGERGELVPIVGRQFALGGGRYVVLGWSSTGGGMQTLHALLIARAGDALAIVDRLETTRDRASATLLVDPDTTELRIGVPRPTEELVHDPDEWHLRVGGRVLGLDAWRALPSAAVSAAMLRDHSYAPPLGSFAADRPAQRIAWFAVRGRAFVRVAPDVRARALPAELPGRRG